MGKSTKETIKKIFKIKTGKSKDQKALEKYIGRKLTTMEGNKVTITSILPSFVRPTRYEINGKFHVVMLDFYKQMEGDTSITQEQIDAFDAIEFEVKQTTPEPKPKTLIEV